MSAKRTRDEAVAPNAGESPAPKKAKHGFRVGPENLPDGPWRRKVTKIKHDLITKAKVKKQYAKVKAEHQKQATAEPPLADPSPTTQTTDSPTTTTTDEPAPAPADTPLHPDRQAMLDDPTPTPDPNSNPNPFPGNKQPRERRPRQQRQPRPEYYSKQKAAAEEAKQKAEARQAEFTRRANERQTAIAERERYRRAMDKAKTPGKDGRVKIGKESKLLLERVQRLMGN